MTLALSIAEIRQAATTIAPHVCRTPLRVSSGLSQYNGAEVLLKATKVEGVYDADPMIVKDATLIKVRDESG